jgi:hypothetical protein
LALQVMSATVSRARDLLKFSAQEFVLEKPIDPNDKPLIIGVDCLDLNLYDSFIDVYGAPPSVNDRVHVLVRSGVVVGATTTSTYAFTVDTRFDPSVNIYIDWMGIGAGRGGDGFTWSGETLIEGKNGGPALRIQRPVTINNLGIIGGGGGGADPYAFPDLNGGGGGAGSLPGIGGKAYRKDSGGSNGSTLIGGQNGGSGYAGPPLGPEYIKGGDLGMPGGSFLYPGRAPGVAITGTSYITWVNKGDVRGPVV